jgi:RNA polymerase sigma-70 factor (ECF subfamily)
MTELELVENCKQGKNFARRKLYEMYAPQMMGICLRYIGDKMTAQDLLHDGFIKIFSSFRSFDYRGAGSLKAWISKVFTNICFEYIRKNTHKQEFLSIEETIEPAVWPEEEDYQQIPDDTLMQFIIDLPPGYRTIFNMYTLEEMSHKEIGKALGINESTSRSQLSRAKSILATKIKDYIQQNER